MMKDKGLAIIIGERLKKKKMERNNGEYINNECNEETDGKQEAKLDCAKEMLEAINSNDEEALVVALECLLELM